MEVNRAHHPGYAGSSPVPVIMSKTIPEVGSLIKAERDYLKKHEAIPLLDYWKKHCPEKHEQFLKICALVQADKELQLSPIELFDVVIKFMLQSDFMLWLAQSGNTIMDLDEREVRIMESIRKMSEGAIRTVSQSKRGIHNKDVMRELRESMELNEIEEIHINIKRVPSRSDILLDQIDQIEEGD